MSETKKATGSGKKMTSGVYGLLGGLVVLGIVVAVNVLASSLNVRMDLTENKIYTLSEGTRNILSDLDTPVTLRFYVTEDVRTLPQEFKNLARRVEDFLLEYKKVSKGKVRVEKISVKQDTDEEDSAALDGIQPAGGMLGQDPIYFGVSVSCLDRKVAIPYVPSRPETLFEYDLSRAITQVLSPEKRRVAILTSLPVAGGFDPANFQAGPRPSWAFYEELKRDYRISVIGMDATEIKVVVPGADGEEVKEDPDVLLVYHPYDLQEQSEYAIDQYLLRGGKVVAFLDPMFFTSRFLGGQQRPNPMMPTPPGGVGPVSTMESLLGAWGVDFDSTQVVADMQYRTPLQGGVVSPTVLSLAEEAINRDDPVTSELNDLAFLFSGGFLTDTPEGLEAEVLLKSSPTNELVMPTEAEPGPGMQKLIDEFAASGVERAYALRLSGDFSTAYPGGKPAGAEKAAEEDAGEGKEGEKKEEAGTHLMKSEAPGVVVLFADADFIYDQFAVQRQQFMGRRFSVPVNGNLSLLQNTVEQLAGDANLIRVRSRAATRRPFTKLNEMEMAAEAKFSEKIGELELDVQKTQQRLNELGLSKDENQKFVLSPEQQEEIKNLNARIAEKNRDLREVRKDLRRDIDSLLARLKFSNILAMPIFVVAVGVMLAIARRAKRAAR